MCFVWGASRTLGVPSISILSRDPNLSGNHLKNPGETDPVLEANDR